MHHLETALHAMPYEIKHSKGGWATHRKGVGPDLIALLYIFSLIVHTTTLVIVLMSGKVCERLAKLCSTH